MLKNNDERLKYIQNDKNWIQIDNSEYMRLDSYKGVPLVVIKELKDTPFIDVLIWTDAIWYDDKPHYTSLGYFKKVRDFHMVETAMEYSKNDIIKWLRENKI